MKKLLLVALLAFSVASISSTALANTNDQHDPGGSGGYSGGGSGGGAGGGGGGYRFEP